MHGRENSDEVQTEIFSEENEKFRLLETFTLHNGGRRHPHCARSPNAAQPRHVYLNDAITGTLLVSDESAASRPMYYYYIIIFLFINRHSTCK